MRGGGAHATNDRSTVRYRPSHRLLASGTLLLMSQRLNVSWRTWMFMLLTYVGAERLRGLRRSRLGRRTLAGIQMIFSGGTIVVRGGVGFGLCLATDYLSVEHEQGYGLVRGTLETEVQEAIRRHVAPGGVVYDLGANVGFFTILCAALVGPDGRVEAFEPVSDSAAAIEANAAVNGFVDRVQVHRLALSNHHGECALCLPGELSWAHLAERGLHPDTRSQIVVPVTTLDAAIANGELEPPDVIKVDVEGCEIAALAGSRETLAARDVVVICELHRTHAEVHALMSDLGYVMENLEGPGDPQLTEPAHVLFRRAELRAPSCTQRQSASASCLLARRPLKK
jgi:FkbM family methyltransferase